MKNFLVLVVFLLSLNSFAQSTTEFSFDHAVKVEMIQYEDDEPQGTYKYSFFFTEQGNYIGLEGSLTQEGQSVETQAVFDMKNEVIITLIDQGGMKMGVRMSTAEADDAAGLSEGMENFKISKTGRKKEILGYQAEEYEFDNGESYSLIWITEELNLPSFYDALSAINRQKDAMSDQFPEGFLLSITVWPNGKSSSEKIEMRVKEIDMNRANIISTEGYQLIDMSNR